MYKAMGQMIDCPANPRVMLPERPSQRSHMRSVIAGTDADVLARGCGSGSPRWSLDNSLKVPYRAPEDVAASRRI